MEKAIKQRLVGGLVLVAGAVLFVPMILDGSGTVGLQREVQLPPKPVVPSMVPDHSAQEAAAEQAQRDVEAAQQQAFFPVEGQVPAESVEAEPAQAEMVQPVAGPVSSVAGAVPQVKPEVGPSKPVAEKPAVPDRAQEAKKQQEAKLAADKLAREKAEADKLRQEDKARQDKLKVAADKAAAEKLAAEKLAREKASKVAGKTEDAAKKTADKADKDVPLPQAWTIQVSSLGSQAAADQLVAKLKGKGYRAYVRQQGGAWKVYVGPELRKEVAQTVKDKLAADGMGGWMQPYSVK